MMNLRLTVTSTSTTSSSSSVVFEGSPDERARFYFSKSPQSGSIAEAQIPIGQMWLCVFRTCKCQVSLLCGSQPTAGETGSSDNKPVPWSTGDWLNWICNLCAATSSTSAWLAVTVTRGLFICAVVGFFSSLHTFFFLNLLLSKGLQDSSLLHTLCRPRGCLRRVGAGESAKLDHAVERQRC